MRVHENSIYKAAVHLVAWSFLGWLAWDYFSGNLTVNPIQAATQRTGKYALIMLVAALACTPINTIFAWRKSILIRRWLGLYSFIFATIHVFIFVGLDYRFDFQLLWLDIAAKSYIWVGLTTLIILALLAATSFQWWMARLGKNWKLLHRLVYVAGCLAVIHFAWSKKADLLTLQGEIIQPFFFGLAVGLLLLARVPAVRRMAVMVRNRLSTKIIGNSSSSKLNSLLER